MSLNVITGEYRDWLKEIISKCKDVTEALYYVTKTLAHNWSRNVLTHQIESGLYEREGKAITNFAATLPAPQSDLAQQLIKDPYSFEYQLTRALPDNLKPSLPSIEELEAEFGNPEGDDE
jgi:hypothetical protein